MTDLLQQEKVFVTTVGNWLTEMGVPFSQHYHHGFASIQSNTISVVLDYMRLPYHKPDLQGYMFSLDHYLFHPKALHSRLMSLFGKTETIFARNCQALRITKKEAEPFFEINHLSGFANAKLKYGLYHKRELVAAITFAQGRNLKTENGTVRSYEWIGFCQKAGITVTGGLSKLIKTFVRDKQPDHIATYVDRDWAEGEAFQKLGFKSTEELPPLNFSIDWQTGARSFPSRVSRKEKTIDESSFPYINSGYLKFEHFYNNQRPLD
jgi:hypothetical protein